MINICNADAYEYIKIMMDDSIGCIITDPLYDLDEETRNKFHQEFLRVCHGTIVVFCPPENYWQPKCDDTLFWIKPISTKNTSKHYSRFVEVMQVFRCEKAKWNPKRHWSQYTNVFTDLVDDSLHSKGWRKPPSIIKRLLLNHYDYTNPYVFDPFMGSGVVAEVCQSMGIPYIGIEKDKIEFENTRSLLELFADRYNGSEKEFTEVNILQL